MVVIAAGEKPAKSVPSILYRLARTHTRAATGAQSLARRQSGPQVDILTPVDGKITLALTETPVIIRGEWQAIFLPRLPS